MGKYSPAGGSPYGYGEDCASNLISGRNTPTGTDRMAAIRGRAARPEDIRAIRLRSPDHAHETARGGLSFYTSPSSGASPSLGRYPSVHVRVSHHPDGHRSYSPLV